MLIVAEQIPQFLASENAEPSSLLFTHRLERRSWTYPPKSIVVISQNESCDTSPFTLLYHHYIIIL